MLFSGVFTRNASRVGCKPPAVLEERLSVARFNFVKGGPRVNVATFAQNNNNGQSRSSSPSPSPVHHLNSLASKHRSSSSSDPEYDETSDCMLFTSEMMISHPGDHQHLQPHSGLEGQDAADYEMRLAAAEAKDAFTAAGRSGQSSDDEDAGGDQSMVDAIHQLQERARDKREAQRSRSRSRSTSNTPTPEPDTPLAVAAILLASSPTGSAEDVHDPLADDSDAETSTSAAHDELHQQPNKFETTLLEPLTDDSLVLAAAVLKQSASSGSASTTSDAASPISTSDMDELIQVATLEISPEIYENSTALEVTLGLGDIAATVAIVKESHVVSGGHPPHTAPVIQTDEEPLSLSLKTSRPEDVELCEALGVTSHQLEVEQELSSNVVDFIRERRASEISL